LKVEITPTRKIKVLGLDKRSVEDMAWCAATYGMNRLYWTNGYMLCLEVCDKSVEHEIKNMEFPISHVCYAKLPKYQKIFEVDKTLQIPLVNVTNMELFENLLKAILKEKKESLTKD
jgi:hypothetical protein